MTDLTTRYLGMTLRSPLVASASPLTGDIDMLRALEAAGAGAVVLPSLFEEQLTHEALDTSVPVAVKLGPFFTAFARFAADLVEAGADVTMMASALLRNGPDHLRIVEKDLVAWMADRDYDSVEQLRGSVSQLTSSDPSAFERANYMKTLTSSSSTFLV